VGKEFYHQSFVKFLTLGHPEKTQRLLSDLKNLKPCSHDENDSFLEFETFSFNRSWSVRVLNDREGKNSCYFFILKESFQKSVQERKSELTGTSDLYSYIKIKANLIKEDLESVDFKNIRQVLRNYFWQSLMVSLHEGPLFDFAKTYIETPELGLKLKTLGVKSLEKGLQEVSHGPSSLSEKNQHDEILDTILKKFKVTQLNYDKKFLTKLDIDEFATIWGCVLYFNSVTLVTINKLELKKLKNNLSISFNFKFPRDPKPIYDFLKRAHLKEFEIDGNKLTVLI
jgi:hypothetical protein